MKSEIRVSSPSFKITFAIGFFVTVLIIFISIWFTPLFMAGGFVIIGLIAGFGIIRLCVHYHHLRIIKYQADEAQFKKNILIVNKTQRILMPQNHAITVIEPEQQLMLPETVVEAKPQLLLPILDNVQRCLIVGASNSGKTTLMQQIVNRQQSKVLVIDPHSWPDKWQAQVVGTGRNYDAITESLAGLVNLMSKRYDEIGNGTVREGQHKPLTIIIDEWRTIVQNVGKPASEAIKSLLTESRKAAFSVFVATHSDRAKPLGLEGEYDLKDGFAIVRLSIVDDKRLATIDLGNGEMSVNLPGIETTILDLYQSGESYNQIARQIYGNTGGKQTARIKRVLDRYTGTR